MPPKQMTANPLKPKRYRPGKVLAEEYSEEEREDPEDFDEADEEHIQELTELALPKYTSLPATKIASNLKEVDLKERRWKAAAEEARRIAAEKAAQAKKEEGFVTEESEKDDEESSGSESGPDESSSEEESPKTLLRPIFIKKDLRKDIAPAPLAKNEDETWAEEERRRKEKADALIQEQLERNAAARAAGKKNWDDDEDSEADQVDDTDGLDPETEYAAWKLRELKRVKREREVIEVAEKEREEIERRRNLSQADREAEDRDFLEKQKEERESKGKMGYMQKYFHKGAFFQDDAKEQGLDRRDIMGSRYADDVPKRELLPQYMQIRDMTRLGRKGRTKYKDLKTEDTGRWGEVNMGRGPRKSPDGSVDERFMPDRNGWKAGASGSNAINVNERRKPQTIGGPPPDAPRGPREDERLTVADRGRKDEMENVKGDDQRDHHFSEDDDARWRRSRERGEPDNHTSDRDQPPNNGDCLPNHNGSPPPRRRNPLLISQHHHRSYSSSRSPPPSHIRRIQNTEHPPRRKRSSSPYYRARDRDRYDREDKRRRVQVT